MGKLIFTIVIIWAIYYFFFKEKKALKQKKESKKNENKDLIMCDKCKTFVPEDEIIKIDGKNICKECYDNLK